jgi:hypothetical protein
MTAETSETAAAYPTNGVIGTHGNTFAAYPNDSNAYSPDGKGPVQGVPGASSHWDYGGNPLAHANTGESARLPHLQVICSPVSISPPRAGSQTRLLLA